MQINKLGEKIKKYRKRAGMSQMDLEVAIESSPGSISRIESGKVNPTKETIFQIIDQLKLDFGEVAEIFNLNLEKRLSDYNQIHSSSNNIKTEKDLLDYATRHFLDKFGAKYSSAWLWNQNKEILELSSVSAPSNAIDFATNVISIDLSKVMFDPNNNKHSNNKILKTFLDVEVNINKDFYDVGHPYVSKISARVMQKLLKMETSVHIPLRANEEVFGVIGLICAAKELNSNTIEEMKFVANQIAREVYYIKKIKDLESKINGE